jgi:ribosomal protein L7/L12
MFPGVSQSDLQRLLETLRDRGVIEAIKQYREIANVGLAEAKHAVDALRSGSVTSTTAPAPLNRVGQSSVGQSSEELMRLIRGALSHGNKIEAIRHYRDLMNTGLAEAREAVETMAAGMPLSTTPENRPTTPPPLPSTPDSEGSIHAALYRGNMEEAIRLYRRLRGAGLSEAKAAIEAMMNRSRGVAAAAPGPSFFSVMGRILSFVIGAGLLILAALHALTASRVQNTELVWGLSIVLFAMGSFFMVRSLRRRR